MTTLKADWTDWNSVGTPTPGVNQIPAATFNLIPAQVNTNTTAIATLQRSWFSTASYSNADDRLQVQATVDAAVAAIASTGKDQTVLIHEPMTFTTGATVGPIATTADPNNAANPKQGVKLPVNLNATLHIVFAEAAQITLSANCYNAFCINKVADYDVFRNVSFYNASVDGAGLGVPGGRHGLVGNMPAPNTPQRYLSFQDINFYGHTKLRNFFHSATWDGNPDTNRGQTGIALLGAHNNASESTQTFAKNIYLEHGDQEGGSGIFSVTGIAYSGLGGANHYHDNIVVDRYRFVNPSTPTVTQPETGIFICGSGFGDYCRIGPGYVENIGDDAIELGAMQRAEIIQPRSKNPFLQGVLIRHTHAPIDVNTQKITIRGLECYANNSVAATPVSVIVDDQVITITSTATGGTFFLAVPGLGNTATLNWNATASQIASAIVAIGATATTATGGPLNTTPVTVKIGRINLTSPIVLNGVSLTGGTATVAVSSSNASVGTITIEDMVVKLDGLTYAAQGPPKDLVISGLDQPIKKVEVVRPKITLANYVMSGSGTDIGWFYRPAAPYTGWGDFILRDAEHTFVNCNFGVFSPYALLFYEVLAEGVGTMVDINGLISDRAGTNSTGIDYLVSAVMNGGSNVRVAARRLVSRTAPTAGNYVATRMGSAGTLAQFDIFDCDFSKGASGFGTIHAADGNQTVLRTSRNIYNGTVVPSATYGSFLDGLVGTGSPEGVVTANVGSSFLRTDGGSGTTLYRKTSGTGNTGWAAI